MRRLLFLCSNFPPLTSGGTPVILNLSRYLPAAGWEVIPLTPTRPRGMPEDPALEARLPEGLRVRRVPHLDPGPLLRRLRRQEPAAAAENVNSSESGRRRLAALLVPDRLVTWMPHVVPAGLRAAREECADAVVSFGPHHSLHLHGQIIARLAGIPHVPFFGDLWLHDSYVIWPSSWCRRAAAFLERWTVQCADGLAVTTRGAADYFRKRYGGACPPVHVVENGYDPAIPLPDVPERTDGLFRVVFTGNFFARQSPENILHGLALLLSRHPDAPVRVRLVGSLDPQFLEMARSLDLGEALEITGTVPFHRVPEEQMAANLLLTSLCDIPGSEVKNSSKLAEYLRTGKPVLALAPEGDMTANVRRFDAGLVAKPSPEGFADALERALELWKHGLLHGSPVPEAVAETFDARNITARLGDFLDSITGEDHK